MRRGKRSTSICCICDKDQEMILIDNIPIFFSIVHTVCLYTQNTKIFASRQNHAYTFAHVHTTFRQTNSISQLAKPACVIKTIPILKDKSWMFKMTYHIGRIEKHGRSTQIELCLSGAVHRHHNNYINVKKYSMTKKIYIKWSNNQSEKKGLHILWEIYFFFFKKRNTHIFSSSYDERPPLVKARRDELKERRKKRNVRHINALHFLCFIV